VPSYIGWPTLTIHFSLTFTPSCTSFFPLHSTVEFKVNEMWYLEQILQKLIIMKVAWYRKAKLSMMAIFHF
jgi:hypothetical protein